MKSEPLTEQQIENWRRVLVGMIGPYALIMPPKDVQHFKDMMQEQVGDKATEKDAQ